MEKKCECCKENEIQWELKDPKDWDGGVIYLVCGNCIIDVVCHKLSPEKFFNLLNSGHLDDEFLLHHDYYDKNGNAIQPIF